MAEIERKEVIISEQFDLDIISLYSYGEEVFGTTAARSFIADIYNQVLNLDGTYLIHLECRHLTTVNKRYRNIILGKYLIIYRVRVNKIEVLRALHGSQNPKTIKAIKKIKIK